jgi:hypothetical protein
MSIGINRLQHLVLWVADVERSVAARSLVGQSDHGTSLSLYAKNPDGLEFEIFWTVPGGQPAGTCPLDLEGELARRGLPVH